MTQATTNEGRAQLQHMQLALLRAVDSLVQVELVLCRAERDRSHFESNSRAARTLVSKGEGDEVLLHLASLRAHRTEIGDLIGLLQAEVQGAEGTSQAAIAELRALHAWREAKYQLAQHVLFTSAEARKVQAETKARSLAAWVPYPRCSIATDSVAVVTTHSQALDVDRRKCELEAMRNGCLGPLEVAISVAAAHVTASRQSLSGTAHWRAQVGYSPDPLLTICPGS